MSTDQSLTTESSTPTGRHAPPAALGAGPARVRIVAGALALGAGTVAAMLVWRPWGERNAFGYGDVAPLRDNLWVGTLLDGFGFAVAAIALSLAVCLLVRDRGSSWANTGAVLGVLGGVAFAMGSFAHAALSWYATSDAISPAAGRALLEYAEDNGVRVMLPAMAGFLMVAIAYARARHGTAALARRAALAADQPDRAHAGTVRADPGPRARLPPDRADGRARRTRSRAVRPVTHLNHRHDARLPSWPGAVTSANTGSSSSRMGSQTLGGTAPVRICATQWAIE